VCKVQLPYEVILHCPILRVWFDVSVTGMVANMYMVSCTGRITWIIENILPRLEIFGFRQGLLWSTIAPPPARLLLPSYLADTERQDLIGSDILVSDWWLVIGDCRYPSWEFDTAVQLMYNRSSYKNDAYFLLSSMLPRYRSRCLKCRQSRRGRPIWVVARRTSLKCRQSRGRQTNSTWPLQDERVRTRLVRLYR
jgi:hypothetical protein